MATHEVLIIGGGISGLMTARELAHAGIEVTLLERRTIGRESSWAGGGILSPLSPWNMPDAITALSLWSQAAYPGLAEELIQNTGIDPEWEQSGLLFKNCGQSEQATSWCVRHQVVFERGISSESALYLPQIAHIRNPRLLKALRAELEQRSNVRLLEQHAVESAVIRHDRVQSIITGQGEFKVDKAILTAGAWSGVLGASFHLDIPIQPVKGQMIVFAAVHGLLHPILLNDGKYLIPRRDGHILAGSTLEYTGFDKESTEQAYGELSGFAYAELPALRDYPIEKHWAGLRPGSPQGIPYIGVHPGLSNLYVNCGHYRNGLVMAPASARLLADILLGRSSEIDAAPYRIIERSSEAPYNKAMPE
ncbi:glycine oxidase ThiO [Candidatus Methylospira mobilis]|uniref:Glycine oxidase ThiO n=1 Tax=Candidatus Methylospira mobilis TaxID=1808979 RepID=A0A5Q0BLW2_9GAMM|nr:glycine oxidase ThiO [Candidatus Methylospira mobilis]QFY43118.1 glycine oxidase ThiO [Candidatus Methylospira mobilis]WNV03735.1 glycine oxidase ThiO [Candidatus Methylospira mobilis]